MDVATLIDQIENERYRMVLQKVVIEGMDYDELSEITGLKKANLYNIKKRAMAELERIARLATTSDDVLCAIMCEHFILHVFGIHKTLEELRILASMKGWLTEEGVEVMNLGAILEAAGTDFANVVKTTCFLADMKDFAAFNAVYEKYFPSRPARSCVAVKELPRGVKVEIECVAEA